VARGVHGGVEEHRHVIIVPAASYDRAPVTEIPGTVCALHVQLIGVVLVLGAPLLFALSRRAEPELGR
jgi:hypothetical protein